MRIVKRDTEGRIRQVPNAILGTSGSRRYHSIRRCDFLLEFYIDLTRSLHCFLRLLPPKCRLHISIPQSSSSIKFSTSQDNTIRICFGRQVAILSFADFHFLLDYVINVADGRTDRRSDVMLVAKARHTTVQKTFIHCAKMGIPRTNSATVAEELLVYHSTPYNKATVK